MKRSEINTFKKENSDICYNFNIEELTEGRTGNIYDVLTFTVKSDNSFSYIRIL